MFKQRQSMLVLHDRDRKKSSKPTTPRKKESELEFTRRLIAEHPTGVKGLAYVLVEIRRAIAEGIIKPQVSPSPGRNKQKSGINKFTQMFHKAATTKLNATEKIKELRSTLKGNAMQILEHLIKEQAFANEESIVEKNEKFLAQIIVSQKTQMDQFLGKVVKETTSMKNEISLIQGKV